MSPQPSRLRRFPLAHPVYPRRLDHRHTHLLHGIQQGDKPKELIHRIAEDMLERFKGARLIDPYEAYQRLITYWAETMQGRRVHHLQLRLGCR